MPWGSILSVTGEDDFNTGRLKWNSNDTEMGTRTDELYIWAFRKDDDTKLSFGTDSDFSIRYKSATDVFILNAETEKTAGNLLQIHNADTEKFAIDYNGVLKLTTLVTNTTPIVGGLYFSGTDLYLGR